MKQKKKYQYYVYTMIFIALILHTSYGQCGNGALDAGEACDDGNAVISDGCTNCAIDLGYTCAGAPSVCANTYSCGNGVLEAGEACDDGNNMPYDGCDPYCQVYTGWTCTAASPSVCTEICGDGLDFHNYACDDGNTLYEDGCSPTCTIYAGFLCGGGGAGSPDDCFEILQDGIDFGWYGCDQGNIVTCDGCDQYGRIEPGYQCNQGRPDRPDVCWPTCGDGRRVCPEACDDGNTAGGDGCSAACVVEHGYTCAGGNYWRADFCYEICGDGFDLFFYDCDDGNLVNGDGCDASCVIELGYTCTGGTNFTPDVCTEICGDGLDLQNYPCDDGNTVAGDGCDAACNIEPGWDCQYGTRDWHDECWHWHNNPAITGAKINNDTVLTVTFNVSVTLPATWNDYLEIDITIQGPRTERRYYEVSSYSLRNKTTNLITPNSASEWTIDISYEDTIQFLGDGVENITLTVLDRTQVTHNAYGFILINDEANAKIYNPSENERACGMESWWKVAYWLYIALVINNFSFFLIGASLWHTIGITMSLQMIIYFPMMHNYPPSCLSRFFTDFEVTIFKVDWWDLRGWLLGISATDVAPDGTTNYRFERQGFTRYNMLFNAIEILFLWGCALAVMVILFLLRILCCNNANIAKYEHRYRWEILVKGFVFVYQHVMAMALLNIIHPAYSPQIYSTASSLSIIIVITFLGGWVLIAVLIMYFKTLSPARKKKWLCRGLFRDLDTSHYSKYMFYIFYLLKRTTFAFTFALLHDHGLVPMNITAVFVVFLPLMYLCFTRPFSHRLTNIHMIYNEMNELLITSMYFNYYDPHLTDWEFYMYARITVIDIAVWVIVSYIIFLLSLPRFCRIKCPERKPKLYLPEFKGEIEQEIESPLSSEHDFVIEAAHVDVKEANRRLDSFSSDDKDEGEREVLDDDIDDELEDLERDENAVF